MRIEGVKYYDKSKEKKRKTEEEKNINLKKEIIDAVSAKTPFFPEDINKILTTAFNYIRDEILDGRSVRIGRVGTLQVKTHPARVRNCKTPDGCKKMMMPDCRYVLFVPVFAMRQEFKKAAYRKAGITNPQDCILKD